MKIKIAKTAIRQYIDFLQELEHSTADADNVELQLAVFPGANHTDQTKKMLIREVMYTDYGKTQSTELTIVLGSEASVQKKSAKDTLRARLVGAGSLMICDPWILSLPKGISSSREYIAQLSSVLPTNSLRHLDIVFDKSKMTLGIAEELVRKFSKTMTVTLHTDGSIHDRVWITDENRAYVVGTSFGGVGKKLAFILQLPPDDLEGFKKYLFRSWKPFKL